MGLFATINSPANQTKMLRSQSDDHLLRKQNQSRDGVLATLVSLSIRYQNLEMRQMDRRWQ